MFQIYEPKRFLIHYFESTFQETCFLILRLEAMVQNLCFLDNFSKQKYEKQIKWFEIHFSLPISELTCRRVVVRLGTSDDFSLRFF